MIRMIFVVSEAIWFTVGLLLVYCWFTVGLLWFTLVYFGESVQKSVCTKIRLVQQDAAGYHNTRRAKKSPF